jgi:ubiquinone/menaquinone biosynthesis C-methylase UbiE
MSDYVHGYTDKEFGRLEDQANALSTLLHCDSVFDEGSVILEAGCGVGAQTSIIAKLNPGCRIVSMDISAESLERAKENTLGRGIANVEFRQGDIYRPPFPPESFDHVFVCFVLEHLKDPAGALRGLRTVLKPGGSITVIEGDHGSAYFHPDSVEARETIRCLIDIQAYLGGNSLIGRQVYPLLAAAGYRKVRVTPRVVYADAGRPEMVEGFTRQTFNPMIEGVRETVFSMKMMTPERWEKGIRDLYRTTDTDGSFSYTFFKGVAQK